MQPVLGIFLGQGLGSGWAESGAALSGLQAGRLRRWCPDLLIASWDCPVVRGRLPEVLRVIVWSSSPVFGCGGVVVDPGWRWEVHSLRTEVEGAEGSYLGWFARAVGVPQISFRFSRKDYVQSGGPWLHPRLCGGQGRRMVGASAPAPDGLRRRPTAPLPAAEGRETTAASGLRHGDRCGLPPPTKTPANEHKGRLPSLP